MKRRPQLAVVPARPVATIQATPSRGQVWYADDVQGLYGKRSDGSWRRSRRWIHENVCPDGRHMDGRFVWWWSADVLHWLESQRVEASA